MKVKSRLTRMASTTCIGKISKFDPETDSISSCVEGTQLFLAVNKVPGAKHVLVLLSAIGGKTYNLLWNLLAPDALKNKSFNDLVAALKSHPKEGQGADGAG